MATARRASEEKLRRTLRVLGDPTNRAFDYERLQTSGEARDPSSVAPIADPDETVVRLATLLSPEFADIARIHGYDPNKK